MKSWGRGEYCLDYQADRPPPPPALLTTHPRLLRGPGALPRLAQKPFFVVATPKILTGFPLTYKLVSCFLSRDRIGLVFPESETQEAADFKGQQPGSPVSGTPRLWSKSALKSSPPRAFGTPISPVTLQVHFRKYRLAVWCPPLCCGLASAPPLPTLQLQDSPHPSSQVSWVRKNQALGSLEVLYLFSWVFVLR